MNADVALIIAMESERRHLDQLLPGWERLESPVWTTWRRDNAVIIMCGIGMVAAGAATEHAISTYHPRLVLNYGCAGAHTRDLFPGDVVIGDRVVHHGRMRFAGDGEIIPLDFGFTVPGHAEKTLTITCDADLLSRAQNLASAQVLPDWPSELRVQQQPTRSPRVITGTVSSGDIWMQHPDQIDAGNLRTGSLCEDMEAAGIGQICAMHGVPFLTVKDISNSEFWEQTAFADTSSDLPSDQVGLRAATVIAAVLADLSYS